MEFKVGDVVEWNGRKGIVDSEHDYGGVFEIRVLFDHDQSGTWPFYNDGTFPACKGVVLKLIERSKQKVKKYKVLYRENFSNHFFLSSSHFLSQQEFEEYNPIKSGLSFVKFVEETMIEVEE